jgi:iron complex outermembrane recepter protein
MSSHCIKIAASAAAVSLSVSIQIQAASPQDDLKPIIVTATPLSQDPDFLATIVDSVSRDQILRSGGANLADALADVPGVSATSFASGASRPVIRGFDANRVRTLEDGIGSFDVSDVGPDHGVPIDPLAADRIEVVRGAATLRYGSQAIGGVVNAINNRVPLKLSDAPISGELSGGYGYNADSKDAAAQLNGSAGPFGWHLDGFDRRSGDYQIPDGTQANSFFRGDGYAGGGTYFFGQNRIGVGAVHYDAKYGIPSDVTYIDMKQTKGMLRSSFALDMGPLRTLDVDGGYGDYQHSERDPDGSVGATFIDKEWDSRAEALFDAFGPFSGAAAGVQVQRKAFSALGEGADYLLPTTTKSTAAFVFAEAPLGPTLRLQTGARVEHVTAEGTPASGALVSQSFTPISVSAGLVYDVSESLRLGLTASSASRAPAQTELFARGPHDGPGTYETGDSNLRTERANSLEGTLRWHADAYRIEGSIWGARFDRYIYGALTGRTCDDAGACAVGNGGELRELIYGQFNATFYGAEGKSSIQLSKTAAGTLNAKFMADYVRARLSDGAGNVPRIPPYHVGAGLDWNGERLDGGFLLKYSGAHTQTAVAETPTGGFVSLDANLGWRPFVANQNLEVALIGRNLTNTTQRNAVALNKDAVVLQGRDVRLMVRVDF